MEHPISMLQAHFSPRAPPSLLITTLCHQLLWPKALETTLVSLLL